MVSALRQRGPLLVRCSLSPSPLGSHSACVRLWRCGEGFRQLDPLCDIPLVSGTQCPAILATPQGPWTVFLADGSLLS